MGDVIRELVEIELLILINLKTFGLVDITWLTAMAPALIVMSIGGISWGSEQIAKNLK